MISWLLASPGHQQWCYWPSSPGISAFCTIRLITAYTCNTVVFPFLDSMHGSDDDWKSHEIDLHLRQDVCQIKSWLPLDEEQRKTRTLIFGNAFWHAIRKYRLYHWQVILFYTNPVINRWCMRHTWYVPIKVSAFVHISLVTIYTHMESENLVIIETVNSYAGDGIFPILGSIPCSLIPGGGGGGGGGGASKTLMSS